MYRLYLKKIKLLPIIFILFMSSYLNASSLILGYFNTRLDGFRYIDKLEIEKPIKIIIHESGKFVFKIIFPTMPDARSYSDKMDLDGITFITSN